MPLKYYELKKDIGHNMLQLFDKDTSTVHDFKLNGVLVQLQAEFQLTSETTELTIEFKLQPEHKQLPPGYSVKVYLFKNRYYLQNDIIELRADDTKVNSGRLGYIFSLDALFDPGVLDLNEHIYCFAYLALEYLFSNEFSLQTKQPQLESKQYNISDFFDDDTRILVLCDQNCINIPSFELGHYLPHLFQYGFLSYNVTNPLTDISHIDFLQNNYDNLIVSSAKNPVKVLRLKKRNDLLKDNVYIFNLYHSLVHRERDEITRFIMIYQVAEIYISLLFDYELRNEICRKIGTLNSHKLKDRLRELQSHGSLLKALYNKYSRPTVSLANELNSKILDFFIYIEHPEYNDPSKNATLTIADLIYDLRNKIVHEYQRLHNPKITASVIIRKINSINNLLEIIMAEAVTNFEN